jgi:membrane associated rhomboid family serine protease
MSSLETNCDTSDLYKKNLSKIIKLEDYKNTLISFLFISFCFVIYGYLNYFTPVFYTEESYLNFFKTFAISKDSYNYPFSFILANYTHLSAWHIIPNCFFFFAISKNLAGLFSWKHIFMLVVVSTFTTGFLSYWHILNFSDNPNTLVIGFSGIVFSIFGVLFYHMNKREKISNILFIGGFHLFFIFGDQIYSELPNIAWFAHLYGFLIGLVFAFIIRNSHFNKLQKMAKEI